MRKCIRCEVELKENFDVKVEGAAYGLKITKPGTFLKKLWVRYIVQYARPADTLSFIWMILLKYQKVKYP